MAISRAQMQQQVLKPARRKRRADPVEQRSTFPIRAQYTKPDYAKKPMDAETIGKSLAFKKSTRKKKP